MRSPTASATSLLICLASLATASGQTSTRTPLRTEPLEKYDNPPAYIYRLETGPRMISQFGVFTSYQANVDANGNNILGDAANEPSIAVDPTNPSKKTIGWRQFNTVSSNFRQGGWGFTTDAGVTWTFPGVLENNVFRSDPVLNSNETGTFFYLSLLQSFCDNIWRSTNGGQLWTELQADGAAGGGDKQWFAIDKTNGPAMVSNIRFGAPPRLAPSANSAVPLMAESPGRARSVFRTRRCGGLPMWRRTAISLSAAQPTSVARFSVFAPRTRRSEIRRQPLIKSRRSTWAAVSISAIQLIQAA